ncbi:MAG TPA: adenylosuccinate lyase [Anaerolineales bacterium]|nr:adenylosuccinate lyase [Anaerolineales bacterium]
MEEKNYQSPFSWRYGSTEMRQIWSEHNKRLHWRKVWVALAEAQAQYGLVTDTQVEELRAHMGAINVARALEIESEIHHDLMAEILTYAEQCPTAGGIIHLGATSMDIEDNAEALRIKQSLQHILLKLSALIETLFNQIDAHADTPTMAHTHIQPAEPTTIGYRLAVYAQDLLNDWEQLTSDYTQLKGKGFKGAVGTAASYQDLVGEENFTAFEDTLSKKLDLPFFPIATQTYPRKQEYIQLTSLASLGGSLYKFAFDMRILQSPPFGEWSEPFGEKQVGSSAMPFKRNPITAEKINALGRQLAQLPRLAWDNAAHSLLERTLDDSANRRSMLPEAFLMADELLLSAQKIIKRLQINGHAVQHNLDTYGPFAATERLLMALVKKGADRQDMHEHIRQHTLKAWEAIQNGQPNPLSEAIAADSTFQQYLTPQEIAASMDYTGHTGIAAQRAREITTQLPIIKKWLADHNILI